LVKYNSAGTAQWAQTTASASNTSLYYGIAVDTAGNVYAAGNQQGTGSFSYGSQTTSGASTSYNALLVKYNSSGVAQWARSTATGTTLSQFNAVAVDSSGNIYAAGYQYGNLTYTYGTQSATGSYAGGPNAVLVKYNNAGVAQWAQTTAAGANGSSFQGISVDSSGNSYVVGWQKGAGAYTYGTQSATGSAAGTNANAVIVKYNTAGAAQWAQTVSADSSNSEFRGAAMDSSGHIYAAGAQTGTGAYTYGAQTTSGSATVQNVVLVKYNGSGVAQWARTNSTGTGDTVFNSVAVDSADSILAGGYQMGTGTYTHGTQNVVGVTSGANILLVKFNISGTAQWALTNSGGNSDAYFNAVATYGSGTTYGAGTQSGTGTFIYSGQSVAGSSTHSNAQIVKFQ
jgi:hypothetical protein